MTATWAPSTSRDSGSSCTRRAGRRSTGKSVGRDGLRFPALVKHARLHGGRKAVVDEPLFPGYVFLRGTMDEAYEADRTKRVANIIRAADQKHLEWELNNIRLALERSATLDPYPHLVRGRKVEVRSGPFRGSRGSSRAGAGGSAYSPGRTCSAAPWAWRSTRASSTRRLESPGAPRPGRRH